MGNDTANTHAEKESEFKFLTADDAQSLASHPQHSAWVGASAGTGKTKVLTDRVLRLLLPRENGQIGTPARRILCLTYTKAAANEMAVRLTKMLGSWAVMDVENDDPSRCLLAKLGKLLGYVPSEAHIDAAKRLFAEVVDTPGGLQIMTIHAFCQSVLGRFPIEAGVSPYFNVLDEWQARELMMRAQALVIDKAHKPEQVGSELSEALHNLSIILAPETLAGQIADISREKHQFLALLERYNGAEGIYTKLCAYYGVQPDMAPEALIRAFSADGEYDRKGLMEAAELLAEEKGVKAKERAGYMFEWLAGDVNERISAFNRYRGAYLTKTDSIHKAAFPPKGIEKKFPHISDVLHVEAERVLTLIDKIKCVQSASMTRHLLYVAQDVLRSYEALKEKQGGLDYDDLINRTMGLFSGNTPAFNKLNDKARTQALPWVLYKLDQGIDHILIDEAQDTNPEQWKIIETLSDEFFSGLGAKENIQRTYFTVGDIKQSIYGFQRAAPEEFKRMEHVFDKKIKQSGQVNNVVPLDISFRSTESILRVVDRVFDNDASRVALGEDVIRHRVFRQGQEGVVELWPIFETPKAEKGDPWEPVVQVQTHSSGAENLARFTAKKIQNWLSRKEILPSHGRAIEPRDIMILVRSRGGVVEHLIRALKQEGVPVSGADRMVVSEQLAVQDMIALARFCLLPEDDLTLAEVLKSPFIGMDEDALFALSYDRKTSLWSELCNPDWSRVSDLGDKITIPDMEKIKEIQLYLSRMIGRARTLNSYEFFSIILNEQCPADSYSGLRAICKRLGEEVFDPIEELMNIALKFTYDNADHLQKFLEEQDRTRTEIKREMEGAENKVRIMTIHGSKGLQAPIVILPDTMQKRQQQNRDNMLWPAKTGLEIPLYAPKSNMMPQAFLDCKKERLVEEERESQRLFYVAMTRAADRLYVAGYAKTLKQAEGGWYEQIKNAMANDEIVQQSNIAEGDVLRIHNPQNADPDKIQTKESKEERVEEIASWVYDMPRAEPFPPKLLTPSRPSQEDEQQDRSLSPLAAQKNKRFMRGNITHKLLEFLPECNPDAHIEMATRFLEKNAHELSRGVRENIVEEVCAILNHPDYKNFFSQGSLAEVPVTALMEDNRIISGQIDRLVIGEHDIWIVDYKTNRPPPREAENVPKIYYDQLRAYRDAVQKMYPEHKIHCALLWTDGPQLMTLDV